MPRARTVQDPAFQRVRRDLQMLQQVLAGLMDVDTGLKTKAIMTAIEKESVRIYLLMKRRGGEEAAAAFRFTHRNQWDDVYNVHGRAQPIEWEEEGE